jgi:hypothetical protein
MTTRPPPTFEDVTRYLNGEVSDQAEIDWLEAWHDRDPEIREWFEKLDVVSAFKEIATNGPELPAAEIAAARKLCSDLDASRLIPIMMCREHHDQILRGVEVSAHVLKEADEPNRDKAAAAIPSTLTADRSEPGVYRLKVPKLPAGIRPLNITLADLGLNARPALQAFDKSLQIEWSQEDRDRNKAERLVAKKNLVRPIVNLRPHDFVAHLAAQTYTLAAAGSHARPIDVSVIRGDKGAYDTLRINCPARAKRTQEPVILEVRLQTHDGETFVWRKPLILSDRVGSADSMYFTAKVPIELPPSVNPEADFGEYNVRVSPAEIADLTIFESRQASSLLAEYTLTVFPLTADGDGYRFRIRKQDHAAVGDIDKTWLLRWAPAEQEVGA